MKKLFEENGYVVVGAQNIEIYPDFDEEEIEYEDDMEDEDEPN